MSDILTVAREALGRWHEYEKFRYAETSMEPMEIRLAQAVIDMSAALEGLVAAYDAGGEKRFEVALEQARAALEGKECGLVGR